MAKNGTELQRFSPWPPDGRIRSRAVGTVKKGTIVGTALVPGGVAALIRDSIAGTASLLIVDAGGTQSIDLPPTRGALIHESLGSAGKSLIVDATVFSDGTTEQLRWKSTADDGSWSVATSYDRD